MRALAVVGVFLAVLAATSTRLATLARRGDVRRALRRLDAGHAADGRERELLRPLRKRMLAPLLVRAAGLSRRVTPAGYLAAVRHRLVLSGDPAGLGLDRFLVGKGLGALSGVLWAPLVFRFLGLAPISGTLVTGVLWACAFAHPDLRLRRRIEERQRQVVAQLPDVLDLLVISVEAGLGFEQAADRTVGSLPGPLSQELGRVLQEMRMGAARSAALRAMEERIDVPELRSFVLAMIQADAFGVPIASILRAQATEMRIRRRLAAQERAQKAPVKMLVPVILCIFPSLFIVVIGPAAIQISRSL